VDCAGFCGHGGDRQEPHADPLAVVHRLFCLAALANTCFPQFSGVFGELTRLGRIGLTVTLFLIGTGISRRTIREVGLRPLVQGILLWFIEAVGSLMLIRAGWVRL
jgi:uncharacterized membrane protein YadS